MKNAAIALLCGVLIVFAHPADAAGASHLKGIREVIVVVEKMDKDDATCGVTESDVETALRFTLQQSKLKVVPRGKPDTPIVYALTNTMILRDSLCIANVSLEVVAEAFVVATGEVVSFASIWRKNTVLSGRKSEFSRSVASEFEELAKRLVVDWGRVN